jgi:hypothetical protein
MTGHAVAEGGPVQHQFLFLGGVVVRAELVPTGDIAACQTEADAFDLSILRARVRHTYGWYADHLDLDRGHFARMRNGKARFCVDAARLASLTGNFALLQFQARRCGFDLAPHVLTTEEKAALWEAQQVSK